MATRKTREHPGLAINHGAPLFVVDDPEFTGLMERYVSKGVVKESSAQVYSLDWKTKGMEQVKMAKKFVAQPDMTSLCESLLEGVQVQYQTQVSEISKRDGEWVFFDKEKKEVGRFDWCVVTSHTVGHKRWEQVFGSPPPLQKLSQEFPALNSLVGELQAVRSSPVMVAMLAYQGEGADMIDSLPFDVLDVSHHDVISRVIRNNVGGFSSLVLHSTHDFARKYEEVYGSTSAAAKLSDRWRSEENKEKEKIVLEELCRSGEALLKELGYDLPKKASFGPILHRWGSAFCAGSLTETSNEEMKIAVCGDFTSGRHERPYRCSQDPLAALRSPRCSGICSRHQDPEASRSVHTSRKLTMASAGDMTEEVEAAEVLTGEEMSSWSSLCSTHQDINRTPLHQDELTARRS
ncbi:hypothetical protein GUITHDRAFT_133871 [Guillardia theta CCMP2712]|uniref:Amine oxidase domain-containing protein n=1 Tax=Guillardia theta (strain CCMP2712) TaxID=905079 RepID=L1JUZ4_GUITC|nr:hypothetical protein GUITHDRAFT_133871 [Guillardia theta CCMP2712]EKX52144.1 hypothetical protein GUITHDRAFT_133871 [Guillardia theta CCMP2712]|eukprot:XP_005839124.1 hypothetical protein GUITHDRAFT_133871 [Guillardia theta CCMP2712]